MEKTWDAPRGHTHSSPSFAIRTKGCQALLLAPAHGDDVGPFGDYRDPAVLLPLHALLYGRCEGVDHPDAGKPLFFRLQAFAEQMDLRGPHRLCLHDRLPLINSG